MVRLSVVKDPSPIPGRGRAGMGAVIAGMRKQYFIYIMQLVVMHMHMLHKLTKIDVFSYKNLGTTARDLDSLFKISQSVLTWAFHIYTKL